jgi:transglutaminase-like putative cysteine protease
VVLVALAIAAAVAIYFHYGYLMGREPCVAFLYVLVSVKLLEARRDRDATLLAALAAFLLLAAFFHHQGIWLALYAFAFVVLLGMALLALGRRGATRQAIIPDLRFVGLLLLQGLPIAAAFFLLFPRPSAPLWAVPVDSTARTGLSETMSPGSISELSLSDEVAFRVEFEGPSPGRGGLYWRAVVLSRFDGQQWTATPRSPLKPERPTATDAFSYRVTLEPNHQRWLVSLDHPTTAAVPTEDDDESIPIAALLSDRGLYATQRVTQPVRYHLRSRSAGGIDEPNPAMLATNRYLPSGAGARARSLASALRTSVDSDAEYVSALLRWFATENFVYTLTPPLLKEDTIDGFLFETRRGFCEHFAGTFVFLARAGGVPARVVTGYQGGEVNGGYMIVRQSDAHAWAEVFVDGRWRRVDPTGTVAPDRISRGLGAAVPVTDPVPGFARAHLSALHLLQLRWDRVNYEWRRFVVGFNADRQRMIARQMGIDTPEAWQGILALAVVAALWAGGLIGWSKWHAGKVDPVARAWQRFCARAARSGLPRLPTEGPVAFCQRAARKWPEHAARFARAGDLFADLRYGASPADPARLTAFRRAAASFPFRSLRRLNR